MLLQLCSQEWGSLRSRKTVHWAMLKVVICSVVLKGGIIDQGIAAQYVLMYLVVVGHCDEALSVWIRRDKTIWLTK